MKDLLLTSVVALAMIAAPTVASAANPNSVTIGQVAHPSNWCSAQQYRVQTGVASGTSYEVPPGHWKVHSWSTHAFDGEMALMIFRPKEDSANVYMVAALSDIKTLAPLPAGDTLKTFRGGDLEVEGGDLLGFYTPTTLRGCDKWTGNLQGTSGDTTQFVLRDTPVVGQDTQPMTAPYVGENPYYHLDISAVLFPDD